MSTAQSAPNIAGQVMTVRGPIDPSEVGATLMHEHLVLDLRANHLPPADVTASELASYEAKLELSNLHSARTTGDAGDAVQDNYLLEDEQVATEEVLDFKKFGGKTVVDVTSIGLKRDPPCLGRISEATGINIIMGSSWYQKVFHPDDMDQRTVEDLAEEIIRDVTVGVGDTGIRSGIIGEVGVNANPLIENEVKVVIASARACVATGAAMSFHGPPKDDKHRILDMLEGEGVDLTRVVMGHCGGSSNDMQYLFGLLERGVYVQFDTLGRVPMGACVPGNSVLEALAVPKMIEAGYVDRILLSSDVCWKVHLKSYGGTGYSYVLETFMPHLRSVGVTEEQTNKITVENPTRVLTFVPPR